MKYCLFHYYRPRKSRLEGKGVGTAVKEIGRTASRKIG
jgi:hypothetical protein